jgi:hypothetical protein
MTTKNNNFHAFQQITKKSHRVLVKNKPSQASTHQASNGNAGEVSLTVVESYVILESKEIEHRMQQGHRNRGSQQVWVGL